MPFINSYKHNGPLTPLPPCGGGGVTPSGIAYMNTYPFVWNPPNAITTNDSQWNYRNGLYNITSPAYPAYYAELDINATQADVRGVAATGTSLTDPIHPTILKDLNSFGNYLRFTDSLGNPSDAVVGTNMYAHVNWLDHTFTGATPDYVIDHLLGWGYMIRYVTDGGVWRMNTAEPATSDTWAGWLNRIAALNLAGFNDWLVLDACSLRPHYNKVSFDEGSSVGYWARNFFITPRVAGEPGGATDNRGSMMTGENADANNFWVLNDSGGVVQITRQLKAGLSGFLGNITNIYPIENIFNHPFLSLFFQVLK